jgi:hypothetical protein
MTNLDEQSIHWGPLGVPERRSEGVAGTSREVSKYDHRPSGAACAGPDDEELRWARKHMPEDGMEHRPKNSVFRKTELHIAPQGSRTEAAAKNRKRVAKELDNSSSAVTLRPYETAFRDLVCSIIGQQDLAEEKLFLYIADLQQQITDLQQQIDVLVQRLGMQTPLSPTGQERS